MLFKMLFSLIDFLLRKRLRSFLPILVKFGSISLRKTSLQNALCERTGLLVFLSKGGTKLLNTEFLLRARSLPLRRRCLRGVKNVCESECLLFSFRQFSFIYIVSHRCTFIVKPFAHYFSFICFLSFRACT